MEDTHTPHPTGYICGTCEGVAVVDMDNGTNLCAEHAIEAMVTIYLRGPDPIVTITSPAPVRRPR